MTTASSASYMAIPQLSKPVLAAHRDSSLTPVPSQANTPAARPPPSLSTRFSPASLSIGTSLLPPSKEPSDEIRHSYNAPRVRTSVICPTKVATQMGNAMKEQENQLCVQFSLSREREG